MAGQSNTAKGANRGRWAGIADRLPPASPHEAHWLKGFRRLVRIMARLRDPEAGCPWDQEQDFESIAPYTIEEAYEVADAIARADWDGLAEELGDLALQVVYHARMAEEAGYFDLGRVLDAITAKMIRRHPHVFAGAERPADAQAQSVAWEQLKAAEKAASPSGADSQAGHESVLDPLPRGLPPLKAAQKLQEAAARLGFDWPDPAGVVAKLREETAELEAALEGSGARGAGADHPALQEEVGDLLFTVVNLARHLGVDPEFALIAANEKFARRFRVVEKALKDEPEAAGNIARLESWWRDAKAAEDHRRGGRGPAS